MPDYLYISNYSFIRNFIVKNKQTGQTKNNKYYHTEKYDFLPLNPGQFNYDDFIKSKVLMYLKSNKKSPVAGFFGHIIISKILISSDDKYNNSAKKQNPNIETDNNLYAKLQKYFNIAGVPNIIFVKYSTLFVFNKIYTLSQYKELGTTEPSIISRKLTDFNICEYKINDIIEVLGEQSDSDSEENNSDSEENDSNNNSEANDTEEETAEDNDDISELDLDDEDIIEMDIPILWVPCSEIIEHFEDNTIKKNIIMEHYRKCEDCEIVDNNRISLEFEKKINLQVIEDDQLMKRIIKQYQTTHKYLEKVEQFENINFDENKINIVYYENADELYNNCLFIVKK